MLLFLTVYFGRTVLSFEKVYSYLSRNKCKIYSLQKFLLGVVAAATVAKRIAHCSTFWVLTDFLEET